MGVLWSCDRWCPLVSDGSDTVLTQSGTRLERRHPRSYGCDAKLIAGLEPSRKTPV
jgi:hypothetical protein